MTANNETHLIYGSWQGADWSAYAWSSHPRHPEWYVFVKYGDGGLECDPGVYSESLDKAINEVGEALEKLESLYAALLEFRIGR